MEADGRRSSAAQSGSLEEVGEELLHQDLVAHEVVLTSSTPRLTASSSFPSLSTASDGPARRCPEQSLYNRSTPSSPLLPLPPSQSRYSLALALLCLLPFPFPSPHPPPPLPLPSFPRSRLPHECSQVLAEGEGDGHDARSRLRARAQADNPS
eukprot:753046-Hanusia_phi.AAC.2